MSTDLQLKTLCDRATEAHTQFQKAISDINPIVGVSQHMRKNGVPADAMTIECLASGKRIILILHDQAPDIVSYQLTFRDQDPDKAFTRMPFNEMTAKALYELMKDYFV
ncbi:MAG: hypothetical protein OQL20_10840 [Sedimenticola sp.]|nr:hypothetical protein [Sedimenticola sp.]